MDALDNPDNNTAQTQSSIIPTTTSGKPIEYDGNPAHLAGILHELEQFFIRTKHFEPFIHDRISLWHLLSLSFLRRLIVR